MKSQNNSINVFGNVSLDTFFNFSSAIIIFLFCPRMSPLNHRFQEVKKKRTFTRTNESNKTKQKIYKQLTFFWPLFLFRFFNCRIVLDADKIVS